ncbi:MAG: hypothetical protein JXA04_01355 [Gammaproteobacteria bacterium]|nr:hypothetical protein [Gammaproteobacteria bacterium]
MIAEVIDDYRGETAETETDYPYNNEKINKRFIVTFTDDPSEAGHRTIIAKESPLIPQPWAAHPYSPWTFVSRQHAEYGNGPFEVVVTIEYTTIEDPLNQDPIVEWLSARTHEPVDTAFDGSGSPTVAIVNSANESYDPPLTKEISDKVLRITRNQENFDHDQAHQYEGAVNSDTFWGYAPGKVKCKRIEGRETRVMDLVYWVVVYEFEIRQDSHGWQRRIRDEGYRKKTGTDSEGKPTYETIVDDNGTPLSQTSLLDGEGQVLADSSPPVFLYFDIDVKKNFSDLGL